MDRKSTCQTQNKLNSRIKTSVNSLKKQQQKLERCVIVESPLRRSQIQSYEMKITQQDHNLQATSARKFHQNDKHSTSYYITNSRRPYN